MMGFCDDSGHDFRRIFDTFYSDRARNFRRYVILNSELNKKFWIWTSVRICIGILYKLCTSKLIFSGKLQNSYSSNNLLDILVLLNSEISPSGQNIIGTKAGFPI